MHFTCRSFIGRPIKKSWSQYWENEPDDPQIVSKRGHLFGLVNFDVTDDSDTSSLGHELIAEIDQYYFADTETDVITRLKMVVTDFVSGLDFQFSNLSLILIVVLDGQLYITTLNSGRCILQRGSNITILLTGQPGQVMSTTGPLKDSDRLLFCTEEFFTQITWDKIKSQLVVPQIQDMEESFLSDLYAQEEQHRLAAIFVMANTDLVDREDNFDRPETAELSVSDYVKPPVTEVTHKPNLFSKLFSRRPVYISHHENINLSRRKKLNILIALIALAALSISVLIGSRQNQSKQLEDRYQTLKSQFESKLSNADTVKKINLEDALVLGNEAMSLVNDMALLKVHSSEVNQFRDRATAFLSSTGSADVFTPGLLFDTTTINNNQNYTKMYLTKNYIYLLDSLNGRIDLYDITNISHKPVSINSAIKGATGLAVNNDKVYLLKDKQIFEVQKDNLNPVINLSDQVIDLESGQIHFWNSNLYLLALSSQSNATIWKFPPSANGFSPGQIWLKNQQTLPVDTTYFAINGKVWVISQNGTIAPYTLGTREDYKMTVSKSFVSATNIVTSPDTEILAFSSSSNLVHIYQKDGQLPQLYNLADRKISSLAMDQTGKFVYVLCEDQKIYKISL